MPEIAAEYIDQLINVEMRFGAGLPRGVTHRLYQAARAKQGAPLTFLAASGLKERVGKGDRVLVVTGAGAPPGLPKGETDGPLGAAAVARAVDVGLGAKPVVLTEARNLDPVVACLEAAGETPVPEEWLPQRSRCSVALTFPGGAAADLAFAKAVMDRFQPKAIVFVEKGGPNAKGTFHSILGSGRSSDVMANAHFLVELAKERGVLTIGIGDGGNEIGYGVIHAAVEEIQPYGKRCQCGCGAGVATVVATDVLVSTAVSNWGGYGVAAALAVLLKNPEVLHDEATEALMLQNCVLRGGMDGAYAAQIPFVDGTSAQTQTSLITLLHQVITNVLKSHERGF